MFQRRSRLFYLFIIISLFLAVGCSEKSISLDIDKGIKTKVFYEIDNKTFKDEIETVQYSDKKTDNNSSKSDGFQNMENVPTYSPDSNSPIIFGETDVEKMNLNLPKQKMKISVDSIPVNDFINYVFGKMLNLPYTVEEDVKKMNAQITLRMTESLPTEEFFNLAVALLKKQTVKVEYKNNMLNFSKGGRILAVDKETPVVYVGKGLPDFSNPQLLVNYITPVSYLNSQGYIDLIKDVALSVEGQIKFISNSSMLFIHDRLANIRKAYNLLQMFDKPFLQKRESRLLTLEYISAEYFKSELESILPNLGIPIAKTKSDTGIFMLYIEKINSLLVITTNESWLSSIQYWKKKLDTLDTDVEEKRLFVYEPSNRDAKSLGDILQKVADEVISLSGSSVSDNTTRTSFQKDSATRSNEKGFKVIVDEDRNKLIISALPRDYEKLKRIIHQLDTLPKQVLVEVTVAEVTLTDNLQFGLEWYLKQSGEFNGSLQTLGGLGIGGAGMTYQAINDSGYFRSIFNMFARKNLIKILSSPHVVVLDNKNATINVGQEVPVITSEATSDQVNTGDGTGIVRQVQYRSTGVIMNVKPTVNSDGILTLDVSQEVSEAQTNSVSGIDSPLILNRSINTTVILEGGESVLLGGLISKNESNTEDKVPFFGDLPVLGYLFKTQSKSETRTEVVVLVTPHILSKAQEMKSITDEIKKQFDLLE